MKRNTFIPSPYFLAAMGLFFIHAFFMFYNLEKWATFGWDQVDNAWAAFHILINHQYPLVGMVAKGNSGIYIGPLYYYFVALFYFMTRLNPIASPVLAGVTSMISYWILYKVNKYIFNEHVAVAACGIYVFSNAIIEAERIQWPVNFIAPVSLLIFYFLYRVVQGEAKYIVHLAIATGISFHIHFTSIFYPMIILLSVPFFPLKKETLKYTIAAIPIFGLFLTPQIFYYMQRKNVGGLSAYSGYATSYYHGLHLVRVLQLSHDAFIKFQSILETPYTWLRNAVFLYVPIFYIAYVRSTHNTTWYKLLYLVALWICVPWTVFAMYSGEITDYYFTIQLYIAVSLFAYISVWIWKSKYIIFRLSIAAFWIYFGLTNVQKFFQNHEGNLIKDRVVAEKAAQGERIIQYADGNPQSLLYFYYLYIQKKPAPFKL